MSLIDAVFYVGALFIYSCLVTFIFSLILIDLIELIDTFRHLFKDFINQIKPILSQNNVLKTFCELEFKNIKSHKNFDN